MSIGDPGAVVRLAVESLAVEVDSVEFSQAGVVDRAEEVRSAGASAAMKVSPSSATRARISSARNEGSFVRVLASATWSAARELDSDRSAACASTRSSRSHRVTTKPVGRCSTGSRPGRATAMSAPRGRQLGPDGVLKAGVELGGGAGGHLGDDR